MLRAEEVNSILDSFYGEIEGRLPQLGPVALSSFDTGPHGTFGVLVFSALFSGSCEGKITCVLDSETGAKIATALLEHAVDEWNEETVGALQNLFYSALQNISATFGASGLPIEVLPLPTLNDTFVLLSEDRETPILKFDLETRGGKLQLFLAFK